LYAADLAIWLWTIIIQGKAGRSYNVGSDDAVNMAGLAEIVAKHFLPPPKIIIATKADPDKVPERYVPCIERARDELGLQPWVPLNQAIQKTIDWNLENRKR
jgi:dTDP-glucose 4,6-dehydratase